MPMEIFHRAVQRDVHPPAYLHVTGKVVGPHIHGLRHSRDQAAPARQSEAALSLLDRSSKANSMDGYLGPGTWEHAKICGRSACAPAGGYVMAFDCYPAILQARADSLQRKNRLRSHGSPNVQCVQSGAMILPKARGSRDGRQGRNLKRSPALKPNQHTQNSS